MTKYIFEVDYATSELAQGIAENAVERMNDHGYDDIDEAIWDAADNELVWTKNEWKMIEYYCTPRDVNYDEAYDLLMDDVRSMIKKEFVEEDEDDWSEKDGK